jgi:hypothetical protein
LAFAILLITIAFNVKHLYRLWKRVKEFKNNIFPLHMMDRYGPPERKEGDPEIKWIFGRFYWGGPSP